MIYLSWEEILCRIEDAYSPDEILEILDISTLDLAEAFKDQVEDNLLLFEKIRGSDEEEEEEDADK
jgi:hypothetical protein